MRSMYRGTAAFHCAVFADVIDRTILACDFGSVVVSQGLCAQQAIALLLSLEVSNGNL